MRPGRDRSELVERRRERDVDLQRRVALDGHAPSGVAEVPGVIEAGRAVPRGAGTRGASRSPSIAATIGALRGDAALVDVAGRDRDRRGSSPPPRSGPRPGRSGCPTRSASASSGGPKLKRMCSARRSSTGPGCRPKPITSKSSLRRRPLRHVGELLDDERSSERSHRAATRSAATSLMKPGLLPVREQRHAAVAARGLQPVDGLGRERTPGVEELGAGAHDVLARREQPAELVEVEAARHVQHAVGVEGDQRVDVVGGVHTGDLVRCRRARRRRRPTLSAP